MSWKEIIKKCLSVASAPIRRNANFFVFMYLLGMISSFVTTPVNGALYDNLFLELFVDLYILCAILALFPRKVRLCLRALLYIILYSTAAADTYCFVNFGSTLNPSMLMLVGETMNHTSSSPAFSHKLLARAICPVWMGLKLPPNIPTFFIIHLRTCVPVRKPLALPSPGRH